MSKYLSAVAAPFLMERGNGVKHLAVFVPLLLFVPYLDAGWGIFGSLPEFGAAMHYNDSIAAVFRECLGPAALPALGGILFLCLAWVFLSVDDPLHGVYLAVGCGRFFADPAPWYLVLIAHFCVFLRHGCICRRRSCSPGHGRRRAHGHLQGSPGSSFRVSAVLRLLVWESSVRGIWSRSRGLPRPPYPSSSPSSRSRAHRALPSAIPVRAGLEVIVADAARPTNVGIAIAKGERNSQREGRGIQSRGLAARAMSC
jgi:hypothetical protein